MGGAEVATGTGQTRHHVLPWVILAGVAVLVAWRVGPGKIPNVEGVEYIARTWPTVPLAPVDAYILRQAVGQAVYNSLGWVGTGPYLALHGSVLLMSALLVATWCVHELGVQRGVIACCIVLVAPVTAVLLEWIGIYDAFSVLVWVLLVLALRRGVLIQGLVAIAGGLQNYEQFAISVVLLAMVPELWRTRGRRVRVVPLLVGATVGKLVLEAYLAARGASSGSRATFLADADMQRLVLTTFLWVAPVILWSALGPLWAVAVRAVPAGWGTWSVSLRIRVALVVAAVLVLGVVTGDHTRVMALVTFPLLVLAASALAESETSTLSWVRKPDTVLLLATPALVVWGEAVLPLGFDPSVWWP